ncbi:Os12g0126050 [Oryza sativa Japonica Group]|uniref:Os12g0126050 protein n=1 Tax=Oryza sativa subsp. japonica TaxID=39947 RepID=A0A0P0Y6H6_ORYSJ|nr:hypothetical protein EE612_057523 [Oryza sativa]BAT15697.1 Os12g0126050 [Oryza sativa Japonica Group]
MEKASKGESSATASATTLLSVNMYASLPRKIRKSTNNINPIEKEVVTTLKMANLALLALPAPSSFATRTLEMYMYRTVI